MSNSSKKKFEEMVAGHKKVADVPGEVVGIVNIEMVTPERALNILAHYMDVNRGISWVEVDKLTRDMLEGRWRPVASSILIFNKNGLAVNAQHTLIGIVLSGKAQPMLVRYDATVEDQLVLDSGRVRSLGDALAIRSARAKLGGSRSAVKLDRREKLARHTKKAAQTLSGMMKQWGRCTRQEQCDRYDKYGAMVDFVVSLFETHVNDRLASCVDLGSTRAAVALAWFYVDDKNKLARFVKLLGGATPCSAKESAATNLRMWLLSTVGRKGGGKGSRDVELRTQKALYEFLRGKGTQRVTLPSGGDRLFPFPNSVEAIEMGVKHGLTNHNVSWFKSRYGV